MPSGLLCAMCRRMVQEERVQDRPGSRGTQRGCPRWLQWGSADGCRHTCMHAWPARGCTAAQQRLGLAARSCCHSTPQRVAPSHTSTPPVRGLRRRAGTGAVHARARVCAAVRGRQTARRQPRTTRESASEPTTRVQGCARVYRVRFRRGRVPREHAVGTRPAPAPGKTVAVPVPLARRRWENGWVMQNKSSCRL